MTTCCPISNASKRWEDGENEWRGGAGRRRRRMGADERSALCRLDRSRRRRPAIPSRAGLQCARTHEGFGRSQYSIRDGRRSSAAAAYLRPALKRRNLDRRDRRADHARADAGHARDRRRICPQRADDPRDGGDGSDPLGRHVQLAAAPDAVGHRPGRASEGDRHRAGARSAGREEPAGPCRGADHVQPAESPVRSVRRCASTAWRSA